MAYGRLDVFWPDGRIETILLENPSVSVGRSTGCTVVLETDTISRYHFSITNEQGTVSIADLDSANGTYVDGVMIQNNQDRQLLGGEEIQIGHLRMIYKSIDELPTLALDMLEEETQRFEHDMGFTVQVTGSSIAVPPGAHTTIEIAITNSDTDTRLFVVKAEGLPAGWGRVNRPELWVSSDETALVLLNVKPLRQSISKPGVYPIHITVGLKTSPDKVVDIDVPVHILAYAGFGMALSAKQATVYTPVKLHMLNQGSADLPLTIAGYSSDNSVNVRFDQSSLTLAPGQRLAVSGEVTPKKRRLFGNPKLRPFDIHVRSRDDAAWLAPIRAYFIDEAVLPAWARLVLVGGLVAVILAAAFVVFTVLQATPKPIILEFAASSTQVATSETVVLNWLVEDTESLQISVDGVVIEENLDPDVTSSIEIPMNNVGETYIDLRAINEDEYIVRSLIINVYDVVSFETFSASPNVLYRYVEQPLTLIWQVTGANRVRIAGLEEIMVGETALPLDLPFDGSLIIDVIPSANFDVFLLAEDVLNKPYETTFNIDVVDASCTIINTTFTALPLYDDGEGNAFTPVDDPNSMVGFSLLVDGRDTATEWIHGRLQMAGTPRTIWWPAHGLDCGGLFEFVDLREIPGSIPDFFPPEPTSTPTSTMTATVVPTSTPRPTITPAPLATSEDVASTTN